MGGGIAARSRAAGNNAEGSESREEARASLGVEAEASGTKKEAEGSESRRAPGALPRGRGAESREAEGSEESAEGRDIRRDEPTAGVAAAGVDGSADTPSLLLPLPLAH